MFQLHLAEQDGPGGWVILLKPKIRLGEDSSSVKAKGKQREPDFYA